MLIIECDQNTPEWMAARLGVPTASKAGSIVTSTGARSKSLDKYAEYLAGCIFAGRDLDAWQGNSYTERGHEIEPESRSAYEFMFDRDVEEVGFCTTDDGRYGASPDGLVLKRTGGVEIKSLPKEHIPTLLYFKRHGKCPPIRIPQVQFQIMVCGLEFVDSFFYQPGLPSLNIRHEPDETVQRGLKMYGSELIAKRDEILKILREYK